MTLNAGLKITGKKLEVLSCSEEQNGLTLNAGSCQVKH